MQNLLGAKQGRPPYRNVFSLWATGRRIKKQMLMSHDAIVVRLGLSAEFISHSVIFFSHNELGNRSFCQMNKNKTPQINKIAG